MLRIGHGFDVHAFAEGRRLVLGGVEVPCERGLDGHSDADVLAHALMDAVLGALRAGDIGGLFPDNDPAYEGADSLVLMRARSAAASSTSTAPSPRRPPSSRPSATRCARGWQMPSACPSTPWA